MKEPTWTHNGWMLLCPIKVSGLESGELEVAARWDVLEPWLTIQQWCQEAMIWLLTTIDPNYEPAFVFRVTGIRRAPR